MRLMLLIDFSGETLDSYRAVRVKDLDRNIEVMYSDSGDPVVDYNACYKWCYSQKATVKIKEHDINYIFMEMAEDQYAFDQDGFMRRYVRV